MFLLFPRKRGKRMRKPTEILYTTTFNALTHGQQVTKWLEIPYTN